MFDIGAAAVILRTYASSLRKGGWRLLHSVIAGLDPAIHGGPGIDVADPGMDARIKSGHDGRLFEWRLTGRQSAKCGYDGVGVCSFSAKKIMAASVLRSSASV